MKRITFLLVLTILSITCAYSQISLLIEGGGNYGKAKLNLENDLLVKDNILGYYISTIPKFNISNRFAVRSEFQYSVEGYGLDGFVDIEKYNLHYIRIIPELEVKVLGPLSAIGGFTYGYMVMASSSTGGSNSTVLDEVFDKNDLGLIAGFNISLSKFIISAKYNYGIASILDFNLNDLKGDSLGQVKAKNRFLQVGVGYRIDFKI